MIFETFSESVDLLLGAGITFGLGFVFLLLVSKKSLSTFLIFSMIFAGYCAEAHLLPLWTFIVLFIINIFLVGIEYGRSKRSDKIGYEYLALSCLIGLSVLNILFGGDWMGFSFEGDFSSNLDVDTSFAIDEFWGLIGSIIVIAIIGAVFGIQLFNTGLNTESVKMLIITFTYLGTWGLFSLLSYDLILGIPIFGMIIWFILTFIYALGVIKKYTGGED